MKKRGILNSDIAGVLADMGHTDTICIADAGLPVPQSVMKIDLALKEGMPSFIDVVKTVLDDMQVEKIILAEEIKENNPAAFCELIRLLGSAEAEYIPHSRFKERLSECRAVIRTGEMSPYANIILQSGCIF